MPRPHTSRFFPHLSPRVQAYIWLLINTVTWGAALVVVKPALDYISPFRYLFWRFVVAGLLAIPIIWYCWRQLPRHQRWRQLAIIVALELLGTTVALGCLYLGLAQTSAVEASLLTTAVPVFMTIGGMIWLREHQEKHEWLGLVIAVIGTLIMTLLPLLSKLNGSLPHQVSLWGNLLVLGHNLSTTAYFLLAKKYYARLPKFLVSGISFYVGVVSFGLLSWWESGWQQPSVLGSALLAQLQQPVVWWAVLYMATFGSIIGLTAYIKGQDGVEASEASWFWYLQPVIYLPLAYIMLKEPTSWAQLVGLALVIAGVWLAERRMRRPHQPTPTRRPRH